MGEKFRNAMISFGYGLVVIACGIVGAMLISTHLYGVLGLCFLGIAVVVLAYLAIRILAVRHSGVAAVLKRILTVCLLLGIAAMAGTEVFILRAAGTEPAAADYAIVLGAGVNGTTPSRSLTARLEAAKAYAEAYPDAILILSGGQGTGEEITEAQCMENWLTAHGIASDRLIREDAASSTAENIRFSVEILAEREPDFQGTVCLITEGYHVLRAELTAAKYGLRVTAAPAYNGLPLLTLNYYLREIPAVWYYRFFG
jgi:uncharacterized SAM-binding protein YcdF (DUF218 family)